MPCRNSIPAAAAECPLAAVFRRATYTHVRSFSLTWVLVSLVRCRRTRMYKRDRYGVGLTLRVLCIGVWQKKLLAGVRSKGGSVESLFFFFPFRVATAF